MLFLEQRSFNNRYKEVYLSCIETYSSCIETFNDSDSELIIDSNELISSYMEWTSDSRKVLLGDSDKNQTQFYDIDLKI